MPGTMIAYVTDESGIRRLHAAQRTDSPAPDDGPDGYTAGSLPQPGGPVEPPSPPPPSSEEGENLTLQNMDMEVIWATTGTAPNLELPDDGLLGVAGSMQGMRRSGAENGLRMQMTAGLCAKVLKGISEGVASSEGGGTIQTTDGIFSYIAVVTGEHDIAAGTQVRGLESGAGMALATGTIAWLS
jgi:hypothetical protein